MCEKIWGFYVGLTEDRLLTGGMWYRNRGDGIDGVYWITLFELLESKKFEVKLVNARYVKNVPGRKIDVEDCQWLQQLHISELPEGAFRPPEKICALRAYLRQRANMVRYAASHRLYSSEVWN